MKPPKRDVKDFEKVKIGEMLVGVIDKVEYDEKHTFKGFQGGADTVQSAVRISLKLEGYKFPHKSRWMKFNTGAKANLYIKYISKLVENAKPDMDFDLDVLNGMKIKAVFSENGDFQNIDTIYPAGSKVKVADVPEINLDEHHEEEPPLEEEIPF